MDPDLDAEATQQATQNVLDPRRLGKQNSGFSDEELSDIICLLIPCSEHARREVSMIAPDSSQHMVGRDDADNVELDLDLEDEASRFGLIPRGAGEHVIALRLSSQVKDPVQGFTFGRNANRCDICFHDDPLRRLSNIHFRIYLNEYGVLMLEDRSTNGTIVDEKLLKAKSREPSETRRTLSSGSTVKILMHTDSNDLVFLVRIPRREGAYEAAYRTNLVRYMRHLKELTKDANATIGPGPGGHVDLFPPQFQKPQLPRLPAPQFGLPEETTQDNVERLNRAWSGSEKYHRLGEIGKGAFATVYKVTDKYNGIPYAAKELDKRKFMKNGVLDQKVENEMIIMQRVQHPNIVRYIEHMDWDSRLLIIIMEYVPGGDLGRLIQERGCLTEAAVKTMARQLLDALEYLHDNNITHRDVKPDNILISSQQPFHVKLTDFGLSKMVDNDQTFLRTFCGTLLYCAPEVYSEFAEYDEFGRRHPRNRHRKQARGQRYDHAVDIWSLGGVLFYALTGSPPFPVKTGISYSELLHQIMTRPLDVSPLHAANVSPEGINFLERMLDRRPEIRAAVRDLQEHPWLSGMGVIRAPSASQSYDEISDHELEPLSQLSLEDRQRQDPLDDNHGLIDEDDEDVNDENHFSGYESEKENYTFGPGNQPQRLFGEVNVSAIGSSGVIPENRLNLPLSATSLATTEILGNSEVRDSFDSVVSLTPRQKSQKSQPNSGGGVRLSALSAGQSKSVDQLNNMTFDVASQSLGGAESILENLNMRSLAGSHLQPHDSEYFSTSKRKTFYDNSDDSEGSAIRDRPIIKRFRSDGPVDSTTDCSSDDEEGDLFAFIPPVAKARSSRQVDEPVEKSVYWNPQDRKTWHLRYPEMTKFQFDAFEAAAEARGEEFGPGKSPLWDLAMKYFPPKHYEEVVGQLDLDVERVSNDGKTVRHGDPGTGGLDQGGLPSTAGPYDEVGGEGDIPDTFVPSRQHRIVPLETNPPGKRIVASIQSSPDSVIQGISVLVTESMLSWGRAPENTRIYEPSKDTRVPKHAFKIILWKEGYDPSKDSRPWNQKSNVVGDVDSFHFYISSKATQGIHVNGSLLQSHDCRNPASPSRHWMRLHDGDEIIVWHNNNGGVSYTKTELIFGCAWGGSSSPRPASPPPLGPPPPRPQLVAEGVARRLDEVCARAERKMRNRSEYDLKMEESRHDHDERRQAMARERERSRVFEARRVEACRALAARPSRRASPAATTAGGGGGGARVSPVPGGGRVVPRMNRPSPGPV